MSVEITVPMDELPLLSGLPRRAFNSAAYAAKQDIEASAWGIMPFRTGELISSMRVYISTDQLKITFSRKGGIEQKEIAHVIDAGARPHPITARKAKALRLQDGRFRKSVEHPGYSGRGYLFKMKEVARQIMTQRLLEALANWRSL